MASSEAGEIEARLERVRKREEDLDGRLALLVAKEHDVDQAALERQLKDLEAERLEAIATGKHGRASAAASGSPQPPISDAADDDESSEDCRGHVEPGFDSSEVTRLDYVAQNLFQTYGKDAVIKLINALRDTFASNITPTDLQDMGGEDLIKILVQIAAGNCVGGRPICRRCTLAGLASVRSSPRRNQNHTRDEAFESRAREPEREPSAEPR